MARVGVAVGVAVVVVAGVTLREFFIMSTNYTPQEEYWEKRAKAAEALVISLQEEIEDLERINEQAMRNVDEAEDAQRSLSSSKDVARALRDAIDEFLGD